MRLFVDLEGWSVSAEEQLLAWLAEESEGEALRCDELQFVLTGNETIEALNEEFLRHAGPTDVITFDYRDREAGMDLSTSPDEAGDFPEAEIYVSLQIAHAQAVAYGCTITEEVSRLMLHGVLHLAGWEDNTAAKRRAMHQRENLGLARAGRGTGVLAWQIHDPVEQRG